MPKAATAAEGRKMPEDIRDKYVSVEKALGKLPFRGVCKKCGWQSYQLTEDAAKELVKIHSSKHIINEALGV